MAATRVSSYIDRRFVFTDLAPGSRDDVLRAMVRRLADAGAFPEDKASFVLRRILERERVGSTGIGRGIAIPHCKSGVVEKPLLGFAKPVEPIDYGATDGAHVHSLFMVVSPTEAGDEHLAILRWVAKLARSDYYATLLKNTVDPDSLFELFHEVDEQA